MKHAACLTIALIIAIFFASPSRIDAQVLYGSIIVDVRDQSGGAVPGAEVTFTNTETGWTRSRVGLRLGF